MKLNEIKANPNNPRVIRDEKFKKLCESIKAFPKMMALRPIVVDADGVVLGGNMRLRALESLGYKEVPDEWVKRADDLTKEEQRRFIVEDNVGFGEWDWQDLAENWQDCNLNEWGVDMPDMGDDIEFNDDDDSDDNGKDSVEKNEIAEMLLNEAMAQNLAEELLQVDCLESNGLGIMSGLTAGFAKMKFIRSKYYGEKYPRYCSLIFTPAQFHTQGQRRGKSIYEQMRLSAESGNVGIAGFRTASHDDCVVKTFTRTSYPVGGGRMPLDFPVELARSIYSGYKGKRVLDPCHGWGGRLVGAMLEDIGEYVGIDPSPDAHSGVSNIADTFKSYSATRVELLEKPFEDVVLEDNSFDLALTSPPYFDVESYAGANTSTERYDNFDKWVDMFYRPLIKNTYKYLKQGAYFYLQVGDQSYPLSAKAKEISKECGFKFDLIGKNVLPSGTALHKTDDNRSELLIKLTKI